MPVQALHHRHSDGIKRYTNADLDEMRQVLEQTGQSHLLKFWPQLNEEERCKLMTDLRYIDFEHATRVFQEATNTASCDSEKLDEILEPIPPERHGSVSRCSPEKLEAYRAEGLQHIAEGRVAALLLAGGQGTRLGVPYPKGMYDVGLPSHKTLYQLQGERILRLEQLAEDLTGKRGSIPWYIMTSEHTREPTLEFFAKHDFFGLQEDSLVVFEQNMMPAFTFDGKVILENTHQVSLSPDGNGGLYSVLQSKGILADMERRGVRYIHVYGVDNILVKMADPTFMGYCITQGADCAAKVVEKAFPTEAVGVVCNVKGHYQVVEYSEVSLRTAQKRNPDGRLTFNAGSICNHFFTLDFLKSVCVGKSLKYHIAKKKVPHVNDGGETVRPEKPNGIKLEMFVFDVFEYADNFFVWEVLREDEFSPLKNAEGAEKDTPTTARHSLYNLHQRYVLGAGGKFVDEDDTPISLIPSSAQSQNGAHNGHGDHNSQKEHLKYENPIVCEISPLLSYDGEGLEDYVKGKKFTPPLHLKSADEESIFQNGIRKD
ncbi:UDP-N-acetylhexosamine pyrophosphorylase-like isoform X2 [Ornithodoros turicata]